MVHWNEDYKFGCQNQKIVFPKIKSFFNRDIKENLNQYDKYDFEDNLYNYELKTRKNTMNKYPDTMITLNKLNDEQKKLILLFSYTDKLTYIEYDKELFKTFRTNNFSRAKQEWDEKVHIYIPIEHLKIIE
jgi:hypothetical protein